MPVARASRSAQAVKNSPSRNSRSRRRRADIGGNRSERKNERGSVSSGLDKVEDD
jgi:hypothetical protein